MEGSGWRWWRSHSVTISKHGGYHQSVIKDSGDFYLARYHIICLAIFFLLHYFWNVGKKAFYFHCKVKNYGVPSDTLTKRSWVLLLHIQVMTAIQAEYQKTWTRKKKDICLIYKAKKKKRYQRSINVDKHHCKTTQEVELRQ